MKIVAALAVLVAVTAGCSSSAGGRNSTPRSNAATPSTHTASIYRPSPGDDAALIAAHIPGCSGVIAGSVVNGGPEMTSTASCTLFGHLVIIDSWASATDAPLSAQMVDGTTYYAYGNAWTAITGDPGQTADSTVLQMQLTNDAGGLFAIQNDPPAPASLSAQKAVADAVAAGLGGTSTTVGG